MTRRFRIHPAIGTARMGNSPEHFVGPECPGLPANWNVRDARFNSFRDAQGRILRQGARFRVFEYIDGAAPRELVIDADIVDVKWRVHLANRKASFFVFNGQDGARDNYVERNAKSPTDQIKSDPIRLNLRNAAVPSAERAAKLEIDPGEQQIQHGSAAVELLNTNPNIPIRSLGTLVMDDARLIVLGGYGESASTENPPRPIDEYASNDTWFDDASDGTVKATVHLANGDLIEADGAWVFVGPPDFAPGVGNVVSLFDTLCDTSVRGGLQPTVASPMLQVLLEQQRAWSATSSLAGYKPSFTREIQPMLARAIGARDVHESGVANQKYHHTLEHWDTLASADESSREARETIFSKMRDPDAKEVQWDKMPRGLGDDYAPPETDPADRKPTSFLSLTHVQYATLREWSLGNFVADWTGVVPTIVPREPPTPDDLDRAAVENSVGGPFYPGIEVSWLIRCKELFAEPLRIATTRVQLGALELRPGFFSQQMALPWQADFYDCHKERSDDPDGNEYEFMWWTAQRPDDVFVSGGPRDRWVRAFDPHALDPDDPDADDNLQRFVQMQQRWHELKFISVKNGDHFEEEP